MSPSSKETQRQILLHLWNKGIRDASELHSRTRIPLSTIYYNINKLEKNGIVDHKRGNERLLPKCHVQSVNTFARMLPFLQNQLLQNWPRMVWSFIPQR